LIYIAVYAVYAVLALWALYVVWRTRRTVARGAGLLLDTNRGPTLSQRYQELFNNSSDAIFVVEVLNAGKFRFENLNPAAEQAIDPDGDGLNGRRFDELSKLTVNHARNRILLDLSVSLAQAVATGMPVLHEGAFSVALDAHSRVYEFNLVPMVDDSGISHVLCFARDITAHKRYESELLQRAKLEERLSGFTASAPGLFFSFRHGPDGNNSMPFASDGIRELFGLQPDDVGQSIAPLTLLIHPEDMGAVFDSIARSALDHSGLSMEFRIQHPFKGEIWIEFRAMPVPRQDGSIIWHGFMHDVTGRKKMEESLRNNRRSLAEAQRIGQMGSWELDLASGELEWSDEIYRILEIDPGAFGASHAIFLNAVHPDDRKLAMRAYTESLEDRISFGIDYRLLFPDGRIKYVRESGETYFAGDGMPWHVHGTVQDITALKVTELQLHDTQDKMRELIISRELLREDERKRIAWEMHEELGQLLFAAKMSIGGMCNRLGNQSPELAEDSLAAGALVEQSIRIVRNIVSELRPTVLLHGVVIALEWLVAEMNKHRGMECELKIEEEGVYVSDELSTLIFRLAQETVEDASRHAGVSKIVVSWSSNEDRHRLVVEHNGTSNPVDLTGDKTLRLFSMHTRISAFGGEMQVFSSLQRGTVIEVTFPNK
jgi:PAS domain S-box-containing protein